MSRPGRRYAKFKEMLVDVSLRGGRQSRVGLPVLSAAWPRVIHPPRSGNPGPPASLQGCPLRRFPLLERGDDSCSSLPGRFLSLNESVEVKPAAPHRQRDGSLGVRRRMYGPGRRLRAPARGSRPSPPQVRGRRWPLRGACPPSPPSAWPEAVPRVSLTVCSPPVAPHIRTSGPGQGVCLGHCCVPQSLKRLALRRH